MNRLEAATGFSSYLEYVKLHEVELHDAKRVLTALAGLPSGKPTEQVDALYRTSISQCFVVDVSKARELASKFTVRLDLFLGPGT